MMGWSVIARAAAIQPANIATIHHCSIASFVCQPRANRNASGPPPNPNHFNELAQDP